MKLQNYRFLITRDILLGDKNKEEIVKAIFEDNSELVFQVRGNEFFYRVGKTEGDVMLVVFGKKGSKNIKPDKTLREEEITDWIECYCLIFLSEKDGQKILINEKHSFSKNNFNVLKSFICEINKISTHSGITLEVNPITDDGENFWNIVKNNTINSFTLEILPPNFFGHDKKVVEEAKYAQQQYRAKHIRQTMETDDEVGLNLSEHDKYLTEAIDQAQQGGGAVTLKSKGSNNKLKTIYNSSEPKNIKITQYEINPNDYKDNKDFYKHLFDIIKK